MIEELLYPLWRNSDGLRPLGSSVSLLIHAQLPDIIDKMLDVIWRQCDKDPEEEVAFNLFRVRNVPLAGHILIEPRQQLSLGPHAGYAELWPEWELHTFLICLLVPALAIHQDGLHELFIKRKISVLRRCQCTYLEWAVLLLG